MLHNKKATVLFVIGSLGIAGISSAQAASCSSVGACFSFQGGGASVDNGLSPPTGSWFAYTIYDTDDDGIADGNVYTSMNAAGSTGIPGPDGTLNFTITNTITQSFGGSTHNSGNMIDRDWIFLAAYGAHYTTGALPVTYGGGNTASVDMSNWRISWNGILAGIPVGTGASAAINNNDGIWGNGNDTLDYSAVIPAGDPSGYGGVQYVLHLVGSYNPVPLPAAVWLLGSGLVGLIGFGRRRRMSY